LSQIQTAPGSRHESSAAQADTQQMLEERQRVIDEIRAINTTAQPSFLAQFSLAALRDYRDHLKHVHHKHIRLPGWVQRRNAALAEARRTLQKVA
jgi:hypothetical protein